MKKLFLVFCLLLFALPCHSNETLTQYLARQADSTPPLTAADRLVTLQGGVLTLSDPTLLPNTVNAGNPTDIVGLLKGAGGLLGPATAGIDYVSPSGFGDLTESTSSILSITNGTGVVKGAGTSIEVRKATSIQNGYLSSTDWTTFNNKQPATTFTASDFDGTTTISLDYVNGQKATSGVNGFLSSTDWTTFNAKQASGNYVTALTGDVVATGPGSVAATIQAGSVSLSKMADLAASSIIGNNTGGATTPIALSTTQTRDLLGLGTSDSPTFATVNYGGTVWDDFVYPVTAINPLGAASDPGLDSDDGTFIFDSATTEIVAVSTQLSHKWVEGTAIKPHVHWRKTTAAAGDVCWECEYDKANPGSDFAGSWTSMGIVCSPVAGTVDNDTAVRQLITSFGSLDMTGNTLSAIVKFRISRVGGDASDTYGADARLESFDFHYQIEKPGSTTEF